MTDLDDTSLDVFPYDSDELVRRLRELEWPAVRPDVRERCWTAFSERLADRVPVGSGDQATEPLRRNIGRRLEFTRRIETGPAPFALSAGKPRPWAARPGQGITAA